MLYGSCQIITLNLWKHSQLGGLLLLINLEFETTMRYFPDKLNMLKWILNIQLVCGITEVFMKKQVTLTAVIRLEEDLYVAECPEVGTVSQGATIEEAIANLKEATELYLEEFPLEGVSRSLLTTFEVPIYA